MKPMNLYPRNHTPELDPGLFQHPTSEYRGAPFWSWNAALDRPQLLRQIDAFKEMGFGGVHIHSRTGLDTEYLGPEFMDHVRACAEKLRGEGMLAWLYDEDRWPSGFAGGRVTVEKRFRKKHLLFTPFPYAAGAGEAASNESRASGARVGGGELLARYAVTLQDGFLARYRRLADGESPGDGAALWYAYLETAADTAWFNGQAYVDTLQREAILRFIELTHEPYAAAVGEHFGRTVPAIFTDEPQFSAVGSLSRTDAAEDVTIPFTDDFPGTFRAAYGQDFLAALPELFWEGPDGAAATTRYRYFDHLSERFAAAYADTLGEWCERHGIALTGHLMEEPTLESQTRAVGEAMRSYRAFHIPGIDLLRDAREYTTAKQAQSAAHQYDRPAVVSELYGVTGWDFDFVGHKAQGDWQAALGVTVRVPHLAWVSMAGEAKRDYPAPIDHHSPWHREYGLVEDHFARLNTVLTRGRPAVRIGVIHPLESYWLCCGPVEQTAGERRQCDEDFARLTDWLLAGLLDFDFISESLLPSLAPGPVGCPLQVGAMRYDAVVVPGLRTIRATTLERLEAFAAAGGRVVFAGEVPSLVDAVPSERAAGLAARCVAVDFSRLRLLDALEDCRDLRVLRPDRQAADALLYQMRADGDRRHLFVCNTDRHAGFDGSVEVRGDWSVTWLDTLTGEVRPLRTRRERNVTIIDWTFTPHGSVLLTLSPGWTPAGDPVTNALVPGALHVRSQWVTGQSAVELPGWTEGGSLPDPVPVTLSEPNVLLLDQAHWRVGDGPWEGPEEILRIGNRVRTRFGLPPLDGGVAQPWIDRAAAPPLGSVALRFTVHSAVPVTKARFAAELPPAARVVVNGRAVEAAPDGWFVDETIRCQPLPDLPSGNHEILVEMPFTAKTAFESAYLLGDFGVEVRGRHARLVEPVRTLAFGDWVSQGLPFYTGNITYHGEFTGTGQETLLRVPRFKAALLSVELDGRVCGKIAFSPFLLSLGKVPTGVHRLGITAFGHRYNAFGPVHNADDLWTWHGPDSWRTTGDKWTYEYRLRPMGILGAPMLSVRTGG